MCLFLLLHGRFWMRAKNFIDCFNFWESGMSTVAALSSVDQGELSKL